MGSLFTTDPRYPDFLSSLGVLLPLPCVETCTWHSVVADHELQFSADHE